MSATKEFDKEDKDGFFINIYNAFNIVFHMDMYKWIIPNEYGDESSVQQDLNLHYVGLTRAKDACYIMNGTARFRSKKNDYIFAEPSSFLSKPGLAERRKDVRWEM